MTFDGNAPAVGTNWTQGCNNLTTYYHLGKTGFTTPMWNGVPTKVIPEETGDIERMLVIVAAILMAAIILISAVWLVRRRKKA